MNKIYRLWSNLRASFWFVPSLIVATSIILALSLISVHSGRTEHWMARWPLMFGAGAEGARGMLSTVAGSMMTVVGVTFSMTLVTLALASSQYTSRILRNFMADRIMQVVLGVFTGIFTYCLIVLRTIRSGEEGEFVPSVAVSFGVMLAICGIVALIFFIHHIASSIQASSIIASVAGETMAAVDRLFPQELGDGPEDDNEEHLPHLQQDRTWQPVPVKGNGYLQSVDKETLLRLAQEHKTIVRMDRSIGDFVIHGTPVASLALEGPVKEETAAKFLAAFSIDRFRTVEQDCAFGIRQLVDIALRALSPGINDTTTAMMCVDYLTAILARLATRSIPSPLRHEDGELRVITLAPTFSSMIAQSFDQIRASAAANVEVMLQMLLSLQTIGSLTASPARRRVLGDHTQWIAELADRTLTAPHDRARFDTSLARARQSLGTQPAQS